MSLSYLFQIYTATPLVFTHMYRVFISVLIKYLEWRCCESELSKCTLISLWDLRTRRSNWAARLGAPRRLLERHLLPTQILQKILKQRFQPRQLRDRRKKMEGHVVGTGVSVPSPLQAKCFGKAGAWRPQVDRWAKLEREQREGFLYCGCNSPFPSKPFFDCPLNVYLPLPLPTETEQEPADNLTKS